MVSEHPDLEEQAGVTILLLDACGYWVLLQTDPQHALKLLLQLALTFICNHIPEKTIAYLDQNMLQFWSMNRLNMHNHRLHFKEAL